MGGDAWFFSFLQMGIRSWIIAWWHSGIMIKNYGFLHWLVIYTTLMPLQVVHMLQQRSIALCPADVVQSASARPPLLFTSSCPQQSIASVAWAYPCHPYEPAAQ